jgi:hypothetical protein
MVRGVHDDRSLLIYYDDGDVEDRVYPCYVFKATGEESQAKLDNDLGKIKTELQNAARAVDASLVVLKEKEREWASDIRSRWPNAAKKSPEMIAAEEGLQRAYNVFELIGSRVHLFTEPPGSEVIEGLVIEGLD